MNILWYEVTIKTTFKIVRRPDKCSGYMKNFYRLWKLFVKLHGECILIRNSGVSQKDTTSIRISIQFNSNANFRSCTNGKCLSHSIRYVEYGIVVPYFHCCSLELSIKENNENKLRIRNAAKLSHKLCHILSNRRFPLSRFLAKTLRINKIAVKSFSKVVRGRL